MAVPTKAPAEAPATMRLTSAVLIGAVIVILLLVVTEFASPQRVWGRSMEPTLGNGDIILVDRVTPRFREPVAGDLVLVANQGGELVKRVVAVAGQSVGLADGFLTVDGQVIDEPWVDEAALDSTYFGPVAVPDGTVFVMGDNRGESIDSRYFGPVPLEDVDALVRWRLLPPSPIAVS